MDFPPVSFYFTVSFGSGTTPADASFTEVSGLEAERPVLEIREGGENRFAHRVPERARFGNLVLKRGVMAWDSPLAAWCKSTLESDLNLVVEPKDLTIDLLDASGGSLVKWSVTRAWPTKWSVAPLASDRNEFAVETIELAYAGFTRVTPPFPTAAARS